MTEHDELQRQRDIAAWLRNVQPDVAKAKRALLQRLSGCGQPGCHACRNNREAIDDFEQVIRRDQSRMSRHSFFNHPRE